MTQGRAARAFRGRHLPLNAHLARELDHHSQCQREDRFESDAILIGGSQLDRSLWVSLLRIEPGDLLHRELVGIEHIGQVAAQLFAVL